MNTDLLLKNVHKYQLDILNDINLNEEISENKFKKLGRYLLKIGLLNKEVKYNSKKATLFILFNEKKSTSLNKDKAEKFLINKYICDEIKQYIKNECINIFDCYLYENEFIQSAKNIL